MKKMHLIRIAALSLFSFVSMKSYAQLDTVVVTAQKRTELLQKTPIAITNFNATQINAYRFWNSKEITGITPNLYSADPGDARNVTSIRGITTTSYDPAVAVYIDGVNQFNLDTYIPNLYNVERIEVIRGPQGTLYGRNAMGGVINIITKEPNNHTNGNANISFGNYGQTRLNLNVQAPVVKNKLFFGMSGLYDSRDGFYKNEYTNSSYDRQHGLSGNYFLKYIANSKWTATLNFKHRNQQNKGAFPLVFGAEDAITTPFTLNQNATTTMMDNSLNSSLSLQYAGENFNFSSQTAYQQNYRYYTDPIDGDFSPIDGITVINNYGSAWNNVKAWTQEFKFTSVNKNNSPWKWTAGAYLFSQKAPSKQGTRFGADATLMGMENGNFTLINTTTATKKGMAIFGQTTYAVNEKLNLTAGIRNDFEQVDQSVSGGFKSDFDPTIYETQALTSKSTDFGALSPKIALDYNFNPTQMGYLSYNRGFRTGGLSPLSSDPSQPALKRFKPEYSNNYEIGLKNNLFNNHARLNIAIFYTQLTDAQVPSLVLPDAVTITKNVGKMNSKGFDLEFTAQASTNLSIEYNFGYTNAEFTSLLLAQNGTELNLKGNKQLFTPDITSSLAAQYDIHFTPQLKGFIRGEWKYIGTTYFDLSNTIKQKPYNLINTSFGLQYGNFQLQGWSRNLGNEKYIAYAYDFGAVHLGDPATYGTTLSIQF
jgi:iron complex outermembrane receptor protein